jgi:hypothetical protein
MLTLSAPCILVIYTWNYVIDTRFGREYLEWLDLLWIMQLWKNTKTLSVTWCLNIINNTVINQFFLSRI